jgi:hypothetical protein
MSARKTYSRTVNQSDYTHYLKKAADFHQAMGLAYLHNNWNSVGLEAVHCVISANDALLIFFKGIRSVSPNHNDAIRLLKESLSPDLIQRNDNHLARVIDKKNLIEYEIKNFSKKDADEIKLHTERFFNWVLSVLKAKA